MQQQLKFIVPGAALVLLLGGYFGLSQVAANSAESRIEDWLYDNELDGQVSWQSVSSSPFGGTVLLKGVEVMGSEGALKGLDLSIQRLQISDLANDREYKSLSLDIQGISFPSSEKGLGQQLNAEVFGNLLLDSGRSELQPFDLKLQGRYDNDEQQASYSLSLTLPELLEIESSQTIDKVRDLDSVFSGAVAQASRHSSALARSGISNHLEGDLDTALKRLLSVELGDSAFSLRDLGYFKRSNALHQRYALSLDPTSQDDAETQRQAAFERQMRNKQKSCEENLAPLYRDAEQACASWLATLNGQSDGIRLSSSPEERVRVSDLLNAAQRPDRAERLLTRLNLRIESL
ncbi:MAG: hypothetical protein R3355_05860 [Pseudomonas sp.]|uniref:hypothetical protein n=1 Tax=Pseudomonas sp. TaxID=306 RepID=UPI00299DED7F|nr:hypothetical protein [Pseudomonas sp.]MDX1722625.1 hypothetical protein [Pseudomonas sp.]